MNTPQHQVTSLLLDWNSGDHHALEALMPIVYDELHGLARSYFRREGGGHTLQATALVSEVYLRLVDQKRVQWKNRAQFFGVSAQLMRRILVDHARARQAAKRGGEAQRVTLEDAQAPTRGGVEVLALDTALGKLAAADPRQVRIVEMRYFAGLTIEETASALEISPATVKREWLAARAWLWTELN